MWLGLKKLRSKFSELPTELTVRVMLMVAVVLMELTLEPYARCITESELLSNYKYPRRDSMTPLWAIICIVIIIPFLFLSLPLLTRNYVDTSQAFQAWSLAFSLNAVITELLKLVVGRPRPDFFYRCFPNSKVTKGLRCTGNERDIIEGRKSFPSGHSSFSFCSMGFLSIWLCGKLGVLSENRGKGIRVLVCILPLKLGTLVAISRCCDNHHHWEDVLVGSIIGLLISYMCYYQYHNALYSKLSSYTSALTVNSLDINSKQSVVITSRIN